MEQIEAKIKGTVDDTTSSLKRSVNMRYQVSQHPWTALGTAVLVGYALGSMGGGQEDRDRKGEAMHYYPMSSRERYEWERQALEQHERSGNYDRSNYDRSQHDDHNHAQSANYDRSQSYDRNRGKSQSPGFIDQMMDQFGDEIEMLKAAALSSAVSMVRGVIRDNMPAVYNESERMRRQRRNSTAVDASGPSALPSGKGEFYREADITQPGGTTRYEDTPNLNPPGAEPAGRRQSTQPDVKTNPNYDYIPPSPTGEPSGRP